MKKMLSSEWVRLTLKAAPALIVILTIAYYASGRGWSAFPEAIVAWGTIVLAYATFQLGRTSREENSKLVDENRRLQQQQRQEYVKPSLQIGKLETIRNYHSVTGYGATVHPMVNIHISNIGNGPALRINISATGIFEIHNLTTNSTAPLQVNYKLKAETRDVYLHHTNEPIGFILWPIKGNVIGLEPTPGHLTIRLTYLDLDGKPYEETRCFPLDQSSIKWDVGDELLPNHPNYPNHLLVD